MVVKVLGSASGGGFPQWNCNCGSCRGVREGKIAAAKRTQCSIAVSADGERWCLFDAAPDVGTQLAHTPELHPQKGLRESKISAILISHPDVHCIAGLLSLREEPCQLRVYCTGKIKRYLVEENAIFRILGAGDDVWKEVRVGGCEEIVGYDGRGTGLRYKAFTVPSEVCRPFRILKGYAEPSLEDTVGYRIEEIETGKTVVYMPSVREINGDVLREIRDADYMFVDGWAWSEDEMIRLGILNKTATTIGHMPVGGPNGSARILSSLSGVTVYVHINNTNPMLLEDSEERRQIEALRLRVGFDGMTIEI